MFLAEVVVLGGLEGEVLEVEPDAEGGHGGHDHDHDPDDDPRDHGYLRALLHSLIRQPTLHRAVDSLFAPLAHARARTIVLDAHCIWHLASAEALRLCEAVITTARCLTSNNLADERDAGEKKCATCHLPLSFCLQPFPRSRCFSPPSLFLVRFLLPHSPHSHTLFGTPFGSWLLTPP
eukprot:CAMPEP_0177747936 /NCGR_PEP_ID=MMETSP0484_2-20121128/31665_1 /TAXON_ID=354590 /ORGANISM="Rhodomonas lens, Strain RHODO" /LENGTH=177 /DNA_ID=CAMNT_0019262779 /DNA_START=207 /DNA_END=737 /DNA_ORIENTATION=+